MTMELYNRGSRFIVLIVGENVHFNSRKAYVTGERCRIRVEAAILFFQDMRNLHVWHASSRSIFVSPRLSTSKYPREIFDRNAPLNWIPKTVTLGLLAFLPPSPFLQYYRVR